MSDQDSNRPVMVCATEVLRPPPARIGRLTKDITLPRTIELRAAIAAGIGAFAGVFVWLSLVGLVADHSLMSLLWTCTATGALGVLAVSWSPLQGESLATWAGLSLQSAGQEQTRIDGEKVRAYIGVAPLPYTAAGRIEQWPSRVPVQPGAYDDRGVPLTSDEIRAMKLAHFPAANAAPGEHDGFEPLRSLGGLDVDTARAVPSQPNTEPTEPPAYDDPLAQPPRRLPT